MEALHAAVKTELGEDGLPTGGSAEVTSAGHGWSKPMMPVKAEVKTEIDVEIRETLVSAEIKSETGMAAHGLAEGVADVGGGRRVQPTRGAKRCAVSYAVVDSGSGSVDEERTSAAPLQRRKVVRVTQVGQRSVGRLAPPVAPEEDVDWERHLASLSAYKRRHGDCNVPRNWAEDKRLGTWVNTQRRGKKALDGGAPSRGIKAARAAKLEALGFAWELSATELSEQNSKACRDDAGWDRCLAKLKRYRSKYGDCNVPQGWAEDPALGNWVMHQRRGKRLLDRGKPSRGMTAARAAKLEGLAFAWKLSAAELSKQLSKRNSVGAGDNAGLDLWLTKLKQYKWHHGDCSVPHRWVEDPPLGNWVHKQRGNKKKLDRGDPSDGMTAARVAKLEALGFAWERR
jgi:hypothetical protein